MSFFLPSPHPAPWMLYVDDPINAAAGAVTANTIYLVSYVLAAPVTVPAMRCRYGGTPAGHFDLGLYDQYGNLLGHTGTTAAATGVNTANLLTPVALAPGRYYLAAWFDNGTDTPFRQNSAVGMTMAHVLTATSTTGLPASFAIPSGITESSTRVSIIALVQGGLS